MGLSVFLRRGLHRTPVGEAAPAPVELGNPSAPRRGFEIGIPATGITASNAHSQSIGGDDRQTLLTDLFGAHSACPWNFIAVNAIAKAVTAGGLSFDWDQDDGEGDQETPDKPAQVLQCERLIRFVNSREDIIQLCRSVIIDLLVFGDAYIEVVWAAGIPVALYSLDCPTTTPLVDNHGDITGYVQHTEDGQEAQFEPHEVIHISLDAPRSGVFGISPTHAALVPIRIWLFAAAALNEICRKGLPANLHVDQPVSMSPAEMDIWVDQYMVKNVGPKNIGRPVTTKNGGSVTELQPSRLAEILSILDQQRDVILSTHGVPPAEAGVIESGNLGGGTGEAQHKAFMVNTCQPVGALLLEKLNFVLKAAFGIDGWSLKFGEVDLRDSKVIEEIADLRIKSGRWTLNRGRAEIGEPAVDGGDTAVLLGREGVYAWRDIDAVAKASVAKLAKGTDLELGEPGDEHTALTLSKPEKQPLPPALAAAAGLPPDHPANPAGPTPPTPPAPPNTDEEDEEDGKAKGKPREHLRRDLAESIADRIRTALAELDDDRAA